MYDNQPKKNHLSLQTRYPTSSWCSIFFHSVLTWIQTIFFTVSDFRSPFGSYTVFCGAFGVQTGINVRKSLISLGKHSAKCKTAKKSMHFLSKTLCKTFIPSLESKSSTKTYLSPECGPKITFCKKNRLNSCKDSMGNFNLSTRSR